MRSSSLLFVLLFSQMIFLQAFPVTMTEKDIGSSWFPPGLKDDLQKNGLKGERVAFIAPATATEDTMKMDDIVASDLENVKEKQKVINEDGIPIEDLMRIPFVDDVIEFFGKYLKDILIYCGLVIVVLVWPSAS